MKSLFHTRRLKVLAAIGGCSLLLSMYLMVRGDPEAEIDSVGADTFSVSALGHKAFAAFLEAQGRRVLIDQVPGQVWDPTDSVVIAAEPRVDEAGSFGGRVRQALLESERLILVLPKRTGVRIGLRPWIESDELIPLAAVNTALDAIGLTATTGRLDDDEPTPQFSGTFLGTRALALTGTQYVTGPGLDPLIAVDDRILLARVTGGIVEPHQNVFLLTDPDLLSNSGLHRADHASVLLDLLAEAGPESATIVFEETLHDHVRTRTLFDQLTTFPVALSFVQGLLAIAFGIWAGASRFGPPLPLERRLGAGRRTLLDNTAELLVHGGHTVRVLTRYLDRTIDQVSEAFHASPEASRNDRLDLVERASVVRGCLERPRHLTDEVLALSMIKGRGLDRARRVLVIAVRIHRWKQEVIHGRPTTDA